MAVENLQEYMYELAHIATAQMAYVQGREVVIPVPEDGWLVDELVEKSSVFAYGQVRECDGSLIISGKLAEALSENVDFGNRW